MNSWVETLVHQRIDADLQQKTLAISGLIDLDDPEGGLIRTTLQALESLRDSLRPYIEYGDTAKKDDTSELLALYNEYYGNKTNE